MATAVTPAVAIGSIATLFTVPAHVKGIPTSISINNQGLADRTIYLRDDFTTDATAALPATGETINKATWTVGAGLLLELQAKDLKDKEFLGTCKCYADAGEPLCIITVDYDFV